MAVFNFRYKFFIIKKFLPFKEKAVKPIGFIPATFINEDFLLLGNVINNNLKGEFKPIEPNNLFKKPSFKILEGYKELGINRLEGILIIIIKDGVCIINIKYKLIK